MNDIYTTGINKQDHPVEHDIEIWETYKVVKFEWGTKRACQSCGAKFYDLRKSPIVCPKCGEIYELQAPTGRRRNRVSATEDEKLVIAPLGDDILADVLDLPDIDGDLEDDGLIEDTSDLGEDLDDMPDVLEGIDSEDER